MDRLLSKVEQSWRFTKTVEGEHDQLVQELGLTNKQLVNEKARVEMAEASLATKSTCLDESTMECVKLYHLLAEREKDLAEARVALSEIEARVAKVEKVLDNINTRVGRPRRGPS